MADQLQAIPVPAVNSSLIRFEDDRGLSVVAYLDEGPEALWNERFVLLAPRYGETKKNSLQLAYTLATNGFKVLRFDQTNHVGESDGEMAQFTLGGVVDDILSVVNFVDGRFEPAELILITQSLSSRCGIRACAREKKISRLVNLVGMVDMDATLKAIYNRDIFGEFAAGADWETIDILGFEINAANFYNDMVDNGLRDLDGTVADMSGLTVPMLHLHAENDLWVESASIKQVYSSNPNSRIVEIPAVGHEVNANSESVRFAMNQIIAYCAEGLDGAGEGFLLPDKKRLIERNKIERKRIQKLLKFKEDENDFWSKYLDKFGIIEKAHHYTEYFNDLSRELGEFRSGDLILDAGCGNGFFGLGVIRSLMQQSEGEFDIPVPLHYHAIDLTRDGLLKSYVRHVDQLVSAYRNDLKNSGVAFSYRRMDFDRLRQMPSMNLGFRDASVHKVCCSLLISYLKDPLALMEEFSRVLAPGGCACITSMKPGCDLTVLYHDSVANNYSESNDRDAKVLLSAAGKIKLKQDFGIYNFFTQEELELLAQKAGFQHVETSRTFGDQANMVRVVK